MKAVQIQRIFRHLGWLLPLLWVYLYAAGPDFLEIMELKTYDIRYRLMPPRPIPAGMIIVDIDARSVQEVGRFPWPRSKMAELIKKIDARAPRAIVLDIVFNNPDMTAEEVARVLRELPKESREGGAVSKAIAALDYDNQLAEAINASGRVIGGYYFVRAIREAQSMSHSTRLSKLAELSRSKIDLGPNVDVDGLKLPTAYAAQTNIYGIANVMAAQGFFNAPEDRDGVTRALGHMMVAEKQLYTSLAVEALNFLEGSGRPRVVIEDGHIEGIQAGARLQKLDSWGRQIIRFYGPARSFPYVSAVDVLRGQVGGILPNSAIVLIGSSAYIQKDLKHVPFDSAFPGVEIHATALANMLEGISITRGNWWVLLDLAVVLAGGFLLYSVLLRSSIVTSAVIVVTVLTAIVAYTTAALLVGNIWLNFVYPFTAFLSISAWAIAYKYYAEERQRRWIRGAFSQYLSPALVEDLANHPERLALGGEERQATILFSDIRDFTSLSERLTAQQVVSVLNEYFEAMSQHVLTHGGFLDKYVGDAIFAVFGMVTSTPGDALAACRCALAMTDGLPLINKRLTEAGHPTLAMNVGINTGSVVVGNLGSKAKFNYTVVGDAANVACRLEGVAKTYRVPIVIGEDAQERVAEAMVLRELDWVQVKGRHAEIKIFQLMGTTGEVSANEMQKVQNYHLALTAYRKKEWNEALSLWEALAREQDGPSIVMAQRCRAYLENSPSEEWRGVHQLDTK